MLRYLRAAAIAASLASLLSSPLAAQSAVPDIVRSATNARSIEAHDYLVYERRRTQDIRAPGHSETTIVDSTRAMDGPRVIGVRIRAESESGASADSAKIATLQAAIDAKPPMETDDELPIAADRVGRFTYGVPQTCSSCGSGIMKVEFHSLKRGEGGTDGFLFIDDRNKRLTRVEYSPTTLDKYVTSATGNVQFGQVLAGVWAIEREEHHYNATRFFIRANIDIIVTAQQYRSYSSPAEALAALKKTT